MKKLFFLLTMLVPAMTARSQTLESIYSDLREKSCKTIEFNEDSHGSTQLCAGVAGYKVKVYDDDNRMNLGVVDPSGKEWNLEYFRTITINFSSLGPKAEWRVEKKGGKIVPKALIVRVNASTPSDEKSSYMAVAKIGSEICVTDAILPSKDMNLIAQRTADVAANKPCIKKAE
jgi:hypothetical protein